VSPLRTALVMAMVALAAAMVPVTVRAYGKHLFNKQPPAYAAAESWRI
jgi:hypothetical protein